MTNETLTELLKIAYRWGRDNGSNRSEKNFNDLLQTEAIYEALRIHDVVGRSEQLVCKQYRKNVLTDMMQRDDNDGLYDIQTNCQTAGGCSGSNTKLNKMKKILQMIDAYWKFDELQQPMSSWYDKRDLLKALEELLQPAVSGRSEQLICPHCGKYKRMHGNGIMHQLCECGE